MGRNIEYDLSPEKMEKIWARYKTRWERVEEVERMEQLEKKKAEFRKRVDRKREKKKKRKADDEERLKRQRKEREEQVELDRLTREVMMNQYGMTEKTYEDMIRRSQKRSQGWSGNDFSDRHEDVLYEGLDSSKDAPDWRSFMGRTLKSNKEKWESMQEARNDSLYNNSHKHGVNGESDRKFGTIMVTVIALCAVTLVSLELKHRDSLDK